MNAIPLLTILLTPGTKRLLHYVGVSALLLNASLVWAAVSFPDLTGRIVDQAKILSPTQTSQLTEALAQHEQQTTQQVVVTTVTSLQGLPIEDYGYQLGRHWGIGQKDKNNGVILLIAPKERKVRIEVGYGLEGQLTDALATQIIQQTILPNFKRGDMGAGIEQGTREILQVLTGDALATNNTSNEQRSDALPNAIMMYAFIMCMIVFMCSVFLLGPACTTERDKGNCRRATFIVFIGVIIFISLFLLLGSPIAFYVTDAYFIFCAVVCMAFCPGGIVTTWNTSSSRSWSSSSSSSSRSSSSSSSRSSYSGGGGSFGGGGSSGSW
jgi:uncharacterized protein